MSNPRAACGHSKVLCGPVWVFAVVKVSYILTTYPYFDNFDIDVLMQVILSATLSRLLPLQLGFERFQYVSLS